MKLYTYLRISLAFFVIFIIFYLYNVRKVNDKSPPVEAEKQVTKPYEETTQKIEFRR